MTETEVISIDRHGQRKEYPSIKSAAEDVGVRPCQISTACVTAHRCAGRWWIKKEDMDGGVPGKAEKVARVHAASSEHDSYITTDGIAPGYVEKI